MRMRTVVLPTLISIALFLIFFLVAELYFWQSLILAVGAYIGVGLLARPKDAALHVAFATNNAELKKLFDDAKEDLEIIRQVGRTAPSPEIRVHATHLYDTGRNIFKYLKAHPTKIPSARRFFTYYLASAGEILEKYQGILGTGIGGAETKRATEQAQRALNVLDKAFAKQFSRLLEGDLMDIENDIKVLEQTLETEG